jgi:hypothetical protein
MSRDHGYRIAIGFGFVERTTCPVLARFRRVNTVSEFLLVQIRTEV